LLERGEVTPAHIDDLARIVAEFHLEAERAGAASSYGDPPAVLGLARLNFDQIDGLLDPADRGTLDIVRTWTEREYSDRARLMRERKRDGFVRECHGDLHAGNIAVVDGRVTMFDCIEFNDDLRWIDVMSDVAFATMDLEDRRRPDLAARFLSAYLERTGDYAGLLTMRFYFVYRAMVRGMVTAMRAAQLGGAEATAAKDDARGYVALARSYADRSRPAIVITHGLAGSGKSTVAQRLVETGGAIRIRSDIERKRLGGLGPLARTGSLVESGLYAPDVTDQVYREACRLARLVASAGYVAIVDATFLKRGHRDLLRNLAAELRVPFAVVSIVADVPTLAARLEARLLGGADPSEADRRVLEHQLSSQQPLAPDEEPWVVRRDSTSSPDSIAEAVRARLVRSPD
jgi:predicted kinase